MVSKLKEFQSAILIIVFAFSAGAGGNLVFAKNTRVEAIEIAMNSDRLQYQIDQVNREIRQVMRDIDLYGDTPDRRMMLRYLQDRLKKLEGDLSNGG